ncbi:MAG TPA: ABC transporter substrate-binding protein [Candidatus Limnocylindria bacterium]
MARSIRPLAVLSFVALLVATACSSGGNAPGTGASGSTITVMSLWGGSEQDSFQKVLDAFKAKTGVTATYDSERTDYATTLQTRISGGNPPDIAIIPGIGFLRQFARQGSLKKVADLGVDVNALKSNYPPGILEIGQVDGTQYANHGEVQQQEHRVVPPGQVQDSRRVGGRGLELIHEAAYGSQSEGPDTARTRRR